MAEKPSVYHLLKEASEKYPDKEAVFDGVHRITFKQLEAEVQLIASALSAKGIKKGDRVMVSLPNWYEFVVIYFALAKLGVIAVPCNTRYRQDELIYILENSGSKAMFVGKNFGFLDTFKEYLNNVDSSLEEIFTVRIKDSELLSYTDLIEKGHQKEVVEVD
ncbi:MAG: acyl--CoA ligase, partial [Lysinibacillus sp.]|nr:acyl--CoA ligase [Lysinibacillus sp.]